MQESLWGEEFEVKTPPKKVKKIIQKIKEPKDPNIVVVKNIKSKKTTLEERLKLIRENVMNILGKYEDDTQIISTRAELSAYIDAAIVNGEIAIDTETNNSLEPLTCKLMGPCIYTPGKKNVYIPLNHVNPETLERLDWQLTEQDIYEEFSRLDNTKIIMHNGKFDYQVIKCTTGKQLKVYWDTMIGARILDENERSAGLKQQYIDKIDSSIEKYSIDHLFEGVEYAVVDPKLFALYAATDAYMTYQLYQWQKKQFELAGHEKLYSLFLNIEMPIVEVAAEMELTGVAVDVEYAELLSKKYHQKLDDIDEKINIELEKYKEAIAQWRLTDEANIHPSKQRGEGDAKSKSEQLEDPVNVASPTQLAILLYDVLKTKSIDKKQPRGTGEPILEKIDLPICKLILERRGILKLINTYIDKIPTLITEKTGRVHTHFNQLGAGTGRFSSSDPINLQNIPSHNKEIRMIFTAEKGNVMVGSDFSL